MQFPEPKDLQLKFEDMVLDGRSINLNPWNVSNPHPGFGKDPNILNEFGHTKYPMWVSGQIAHNEAEEKALRGETVEAPVEPPKANGW